MPSAVRLAIRLLWASLALSLVSLIPGFRVGYWDDTEYLSLAVILGLSVVGILVSVTLIVLIGKRHNWARWVLLILTLLGWLMLAEDIETTLDQGGLAVAAELAISIAEIAAFRLLFFGEGARWFKATE